MLLFQFLVNIGNQHECISIALYQIRLAGVCQSLVIFLLLHTHIRQIEESEVVFGVQLLRLQVVLFGQSELVEFVEGVGAVELDFVVVRVQLDGVVVDNEGFFVHILFAQIVGFLE